jgi:hypothetical protein
MEKKLKSDSPLRAATCSRSSDVRECGEVTVSRNGYIEQVERERDAALAREAAIIQFCEVEMGWEFFRAEFQIGDKPSKSLENAMKLRKFLSENARGMARELAAQDSHNTTNVNG